MAYRNWFNKVKREFSRYAKHPNLQGRPINYVEIGCWIGGSAWWMCDNVLCKNHKSHGFGIDPYEPMPPKHTVASMAEVQAIARRAISGYEECGMWEWIVGRSQDVLRTWPHGRIDFLYIDGAHNAHDAVTDFVLAWPYLQTGSIVVFDDYGIGLRKRLVSHIPEVPDAVDAIMLVYGPLVKEIGRGFQFALEVTKHVEAGVGFTPRDIRNAERQRRSNPPAPGSAAWRRQGREQRRKRLKRGQ